MTFAIGFRSIQYRARNVLRRAAMGARMGVHMDDTTRVVCAWCGRDLAEVPLADHGSPMWYGVCAGCSTGVGKGLFPSQSLSDLSEDQYDRLPFGLLELDATGHVRKYNAAEEALSGLQRDAVLGRDFFKEVAPCTRVREFEGVFREMVERAETARRTFDFLFRFAGGDRFVHIAMCYDAPSERALILVQAAASQERAAAPAPTE